MLLSLDISTSCTGWCVFDQNTFRDMGYINLSKHKGLFDKATQIQAELTKIYKKYDVDEVVVEENLQAFRPGLSSAKTLMTLAQFNGVVCWICYNSMKVPVHRMNVNSARKLVGLKINRKSKLTTKEQVLNHVSLLENSIDWPTKVVSRGKFAGTTRVINEAYDMADAYVIGKSFLIEKSK